VNRAKVEEKLMRIAITGASGMVGTALDALLRTRGHHVIPVSRRALPGGVVWNPEHDEIDAAGLEGADAVVHLAGETLSGRWTVASKRRIWDSRILGTTLLSAALAELANPPRVLISASAIGYYGYRHGDEWLDESAPGGDDFLARLCVAWEVAADRARGAGIRVVHPRFGLVLSNHGGALARMLMPFRCGLGGHFGRGTQWISWITIDDLVAGLLHTLTTGTVSGPINFVAPDPARNIEFTRELAGALHRPSFLTLAAPVLRLAFGREMAELTLLASQRVSAKTLIASGFTFRQPELGGALHHLLSA
jgi:uncharacterized protein